MPASPSRFAEYDAALGPRQQCQVCRFLADAPKADADFITSLLVNPDKGHAHISKVLTAGQVKASQKAVANHRANHMP